MVRGRVVDPNGQPLVGIAVYDASGWVPGPEMTHTAADGTFEVGCTRGPILLTGTGPDFLGPESPEQNWQRTFVGGGSTLAEAATPSCGPRSQQSEVVTTMFPGGMITGRVIDGDGNPVVGDAGRIGVYADIPGLWPDAYETSASCDGSNQYWLVGLPPGDYKLFAPYFPTGPDVSFQTVHVEVGQVTVSDWYRPPNSSSS